MSLFRSICWLFAGRCAEGEATPSKQTKRGEASSGDLGQKEAELEKAKEEELRHMESGETER
jgi:hypothetical protein